MAERLETLPAKQVACVRFPVPARPTFCVEKWHFSVTLRPGAHCKHCNRALSLETRKRSPPGGMTVLGHS
jgi:hypothetical protein